MGLVIVGIL